MSLGSSLTTKSDFLAAPVPFSPMSTSTVVAESRVALISTKSLLPSVTTNPLTLAIVAEGAISLSLIVTSTSFAEPAIPLTRLSIDNFNFSLGSLNIVSSSAKA